MLAQQQRDLDKLADSLVAALADLDPAGERLAIALYRQLATGRPVSAAELAAATGLPERAVAGTLGRWPAVFSDSQGRVTGFCGSTVSGWSKSACTAISASRGRTSPVSGGHSSAPHTAAPALSWARHRRPLPAAKIRRGTPTSTSCSTGRARSPLSTARPQPRWGTCSTKWPR
jgi:hypothetical protein